MENFDFNKSSCGIILSEDFIRKNQNKVDWEDISECQSLSENFIREFEDKIHWWLLSQCEYSYEFIKEFKDKFSWSFISPVEYSYDFIEEFKDEINEWSWDNMSCYDILSEEFIIRFQDYIDWDFVSRYQKLSKQFIGNYKHKLNFDAVSSNKTIWFLDIQFADGSSNLMMQYVNKYIIRDLTNIIYDYYHYVF